MSGVCATLILAQDGFALLDWVCTGAHPSTTTAVAQDVGCRVHEALLASAASSHTGAVLDRGGVAAAHQHVSPREARVLTTVAQVLYRDLGLEPARDMQLFLTPHLYANCHLHDPAPLLIVQSVPHSGARCAWDAPQAHVVCDAVAGAGTTATGRLVLTRLPHQRLQQRARV